MRRALLLLFALGILFLVIRTSESDHTAPAMEEQRSGSVGLTGRLVDANGTPVAKADVFAAERHSQFAWPLDAPAWTELDRAVQRAVTDSEGCFRFENFHEGLVDMSIRASGFALQELRGSSVSAGTETNLGDIRVQAGTKVHGTLMSHAREAIADAELYFLRPESALPHAHAWTGAPLGRTDARGMFEITSLEPGPFTLVVRANRETPYRLQGDVQDTLDLGLIVLPEPAAISGVVRDFPHGELSDLQVVALPTRAVPYAVIPGEMRGSPARWLEGYRSAPIGDVGSFLLTGLHPGQHYSLRVLAPGDELRTADYWSPPRLVPSGTDDVVLTAHPSVRMDFRVVDALTDDPIEGFEYEWIGARNLPRRGVDYLRAATQDRRVFLKVEATGYENYRSGPLAIIAGNPLTPLQVRLARLSSIQELPDPIEEPEQPVNHLHALPGFSKSTTRNAKPVAHGQETVTGSIHIGQDPLIGAVLALYPLRTSEEFFEARDDAIQTGRTDRDGQFALRNVPVGDHILAIEHGSRARMTLRTVNAANPDAKIELESLTLHGQVVAANGTPIAGAHIHLPEHWKRQSKLMATAGDDDQNLLAWPDLRTPPVVCTTDQDGQFTLNGLEADNAIVLGARAKEHGAGTLRLANLDREATILLSSNSLLTVDGFGPKPLERVLGVAWRWGVDYDHELRISFSANTSEAFHGLSADEWTVFQAEVDGWGEPTSLRVLTPVLLNPINDSLVNILH